MPCLVLILILAFPRVVLVLMLLLSTYIERAYHGLIIPLLGFIFLPLTTIVYALMVNNGLPIADSYLLILIIAVAIDIGSHGGAEWHRRNR
jgi:hypothetical protein